MAVALSSLFNWSKRLLRSLASLKAPLMTSLESVPAGSQRLRGTRRDCELSCSNGVRSGDGCPWSRWLARWGWT